MPINLSSIRNYKNLILLLVSVAATLSIINSGVFFNDDNNNRFSSISRVYAQKSTSTASANEITITSNSAQFLPLTNATHNQLKVIVHYQTNEISLVNTRINGVMQVSLSNGSLVRTSSFPNGFIVGQSGTIQFATSFADKTIQM